MKKLVAGALAALVLAAPAAGQTLLPSDEQGTGEFGYSLAFSGDGKTLLVGGYKDAIGLGAAWVFTALGGTWVQQGPKLIAPDEHGTGWFGQSVALSQDGNTAVIGIPQENENTGTARVFVRSGDAWQQQAELNNGGAEDALGLGVALSGDGNVALLGAPKHNAVIGGAYVFTRTGSTWRRQPLVLRGRGELRSGEFGLAVAMSADGKTLAVGGPGDNSGAGAVWTFARVGSRWVAGPKLLARGERGHAEFGYSVALSADGKTLVVGGFRDNATKGAAWVFGRAANAWVQRAKLTAVAGPQAGLGFSVAVSADGTAVLTGGPAARNGSGAAWLFRRTTGGAWHLRRHWNGAARTGLGYGVALSGDGHLAAIGAPNDAGGSVNVVHV
ncbi:MAG: hypothetical protein JO017_04550 [Actinobacteria bacterium]|nr:hypothetical protein [Actinomycetota bacterium]